jgi:epoxyqueuosine reductase
VKILLHTCCAPCTIYPLLTLRRMEFSVQGLFYNPNIHPYREYCKRRETLETFAQNAEFPVIWTSDYTLEEFLRSVVFREEERCRVCYHLRLERAAQVAKHGKFDGFSTTLLYSTFQRHELLQELGESLGKKWDVPFLYFDFRRGWEEGIRASQLAGMYRQSYCGCIYSEKDRYFRRPPLLHAAEKKAAKGSCAGKG